ncbi:MAG TPA: hypothetical protein VFM54_16675 [Micromonosporaceae bacterium]|nr:hypothetical protein [Micromonosporaceae bacterium]
MATSVAPLVAGWQRQRHWPGAVLAGPSQGGHAGGAVPTPTQVPYSWLTPPVVFRPDPPINSAAVSNAGSGSGQAVDTAHRDEYTTWHHPVELDSAITGDPAALAAFLVDQYAADPPRQRCPSLTLMLNARTSAEIVLILSREIGDRIVIAGAPATWPEGTTSMLIDGISHSIAVDTRYVTWSTTPVIGDDPGEPGPWFRLDESYLDGTHYVPF